MILVVDSAEDDDNDAGASRLEAADVLFNNGATDLFAHFDAIILAD
jgi:hypothetical protein